MPELVIVRRRASAGGAQPRDGLGAHNTAHRIARRRRGILRGRSARRGARSIGREVRPMEYQVISADCHIDMTWMPGDLWVKNAPAKWRDQVPQVRESAEVLRWYAADNELGVFGGLGFGFDRVHRCFSKHVAKMFEVGFYEGGRHHSTPALRRKGA